MGLQLLVDDLLVFNGILDKPDISIGITPTCNTESKVQTISLNEDTNLNFKFVNLL